MREMKASKPTEDPMFMSARSRLMRVVTAIDIRGREVGSWTCEKGGGGLGSWNIRGGDGTYFGDGGREWETAFAGKGPEHS